jgi:hypothetical protein
MCWKALSVAGSQVTFRPSNVHQVGPVSQSRPLTTGRSPAAARTRIGARRGDGMLAADSGNPVDRCQGGRNDQIDGRQQAETAAGGTGRGHGREVRRAHEARGWKRHEERLGAVRSAHERLVRAGRQDTGALRGPYGHGAASDFPRMSAEFTVMGPVPPQRNDAGDFPDAISVVRLTAISTRSERHSSNLSPGRQRVSWCRA